MSLLPGPTLFQDPLDSLVSQALVRSFSSTARNRLENRVAEKQKIFQADNDLPVHLKGGATDNILYRVTMTLCLGGECRMGVGKGLVPGLGFGEAGWTVWDSGLVNREGAP
uniref:Cytochrome c oxidase subunit 7A1, mitochondrial n=1 Tax=Sus scrofa TaxID=9823 RepID=A0A8D0JMJ0_PIG